MIGDLLARDRHAAAPGFLQHDGYYRELGRFVPEPAARAPATCASTSTTRRACWPRSRTCLADRGVSVAQVVQHPAPDGVHIVILTHVADEGAVRAAARARGALGFNRQAPVILPVLARGG